MTDAVTEFFLTSNPLVVLIDTMELTHPSWAEPVRFTRNDYAGFTGEVDGVAVFFPFVQSTVKAAGVTGDLDYKLEIQLALGYELINLLSTADLTQPIAAVYRGYRSDSTDALYELPLVVDELVFKQDIVQFTAAATPMNDTGTGETYALSRFVGLSPLL